MPGGSRISCMISGVFPSLGWYHTDPAQHLRTAGQDLDDVDRDLSVRRVHRYR